MLSFISYKTARPIILSFFPVLSPWLVIEPLLCAMLCPRSWVALEILSWS